MPWLKGFGEKSQSNQYIIIIHKMQKIVKKKTWHVENVLYNFFICLFKHFVSLNNSSGR